MLDQSQIGSIKNILLDRSTVVECNLFTVDDESTVGSSEISFELGLDCSELSERRSDLFIPDVSYTSFR